MGQRWTGWVIGVGTDAPKDIEFGDVVELSRWSSVEWHSLPYISFLGKRQREEPTILRCGLREIQLEGYEQFAVVTADQIIFKLCDWEWVSEGKGRKPSVIPIGNRVLVQHDTPPERLGNIINPKWGRKWNPLCQVIATGADVDDLMPGDWVLLSGSHVGSHVEINRQEHSLVTMDDVALRWDERPIEYIEYQIWHKPQEV